VIKSDTLSFYRHISYHNEENSFKIAKLKVGGRHELVTIVGNLHSLTPGGVLKLKGRLKGTGDDDQNR